MAKAYIDLSGRAGLVYKHEGDVNDVSGTPRPNLRYLGADGQMAQGIYNPVRNYGYMSPASTGFVTVTESNAPTDFTNEIAATIYDSASQLAFFAEDNGMVWRLTNAGTFYQWREPTTITFPISGATNTDMEIYQVNGSKVLFGSYQKAGGGDIWRVNLTTTEVAGGSQTYLSSVATSGFALGASNDHFMRTADNGFMYIFDGNAVHKLDGTASGGSVGTATANVLLFPAGFITVDAVDWRGLMWIGVQTSAVLGSSGTGAYEERTVGVYVWDRQSTVVNTVDFIPLNGVREIRKLYVTATGKFRAIVISSDRFTQIREYNGQTFETIAEAHIKAYPPYKDSFTRMGDLAVWLAADSKWYAHGRAGIGDSEGLFQIGDISSLNGGALTTGAVLLLDATLDTTFSRSGFVFSALASGPTIYNRLWYPHGQGSVTPPTSGTPFNVTGLAGNVYTLVKMLPKLSTLNYINVFCLPTASATSTTCATITIYLNQSTTAFKTYTVPLSEASRGYVTIPIRKPYVNSVQLKITWPTDVTLGTNDFITSYAEVDYTPVAPFK